MNCTDCHESLVRTPSGFCCPNGHGRIVPAQKVTAAGKAEAVAALPQATELQGFASTARGFASRKRFRISGFDGVWAMLDKQLPHAVRAAKGGQRRWFARDTLIEREVFRAMGIEVAEFSVPQEQ